VKDEELAGHSSEGPTESVRYKGIVDQTSLGVLVVRQEDPDDLGSFRIVYANPAASEASRTSVDRFVGNMLLESFPNVTTELLQAYVEVIRTGEPARIGELR
jgi:PAS domain-containing protein